MSNVRISNGSPTLERMEARQSEYPKPSACRNLFGPVNHEELNRDLKKHRKEMEEACQRKWNFDFQNHKPLEGRSAGRQSLDVNGNCQTAICAASQGISEDTHCVGRKTDVAGSQTDFAEQCHGQRKRPAADGNVTPRAATRAAPGPPARPPRLPPAAPGAPRSVGAGAESLAPLGSPLRRRGGEAPNAGLGAKLKRASLAEREARPCPPSRSPVADVGMRGCAGISPGPVAPPAPGCRASTLQDNILNRCSPPPHPTSPCF
uniref:Cyclin-dependent kinase inhibitor 1B n=1 Tax=Chrysolophus pictus TaxID=9089 RepID=A0A8C3L6C1_CHRPC